MKRDKSTPKRKPRPLLSAPKRKRRSREHVLGGQLIADVIELPAEITKEEIYDLHARTSTKLRLDALDKASADAKVEVLREHIIRCIGGYRNARNYQRRPTTVEIRERLQSAQGALKNLWRGLGLPGEPSEVASGEIPPNEVKISSALSELIRPVVDDFGRACEPERFRDAQFPGFLVQDWSTLEDRLATGGNMGDCLRPASAYADERIFEAINCLVQLSIWIDAAKSQAIGQSPQPPREKDWPLYCITRDLAKVYEATFERKPMETAGGPWLQFLGHVLNLSGEANRSPEALRQLWRKARSVATASPR